LVFIGFGGCQWVSGWIRHPTARNRQRQKLFKFGGSPFTIYALRLFQRSD
jgi:hypothetical protein